MPQEIKGNEIKENETREDNHAGVDTSLDVDLDNNLEVDNKPGLNASIDPESKTTDAASNYIPLKTLLREQKIGKKFASILLAYWQTRINDIDTNAQDKLFESFILANSVSACLAGVYIFEANTESLYYEFGPEELNLRNTITGLLPQAIFTDENSPSMEIEIEQEILHVNFTAIRTEEIDFTLVVVSPVETYLAKTVVKLENIINNYFLSSVVSKNTQLIDFFKMTSADIIKQTEGIPDSEPITFIYLEFEKLKKFVEIGGDYFAVDLVQEIKNKVLDVFEEDSLIYALTLRNYLVVVPSINKDDAMAIFKQITFQIKNVLFSRKVKYFTAFSPITNLDHIWQELIQG